MTSQQLQLLTLDSTAQEAAKKLIKAYVKRGDSLDSIRQGLLGASSPNGMSASISGYLNGKKYNSDTIIVYRDINGQQVDTTFKFSDIVKKIREEL